MQQIFRKWAKNAHFVSLLTKKSDNFQTILIYLALFLATKTQIEQFRKASLCLKIKSITLLLTFNIFSKIDEMLVKDRENVNKNNGKSPSIRKLLNLDKTICKQRNQKILRWMGFLMIPLATLYDE